MDKEKKTRRGTRTAAQRRVASPRRIAADSNTVQQASRVRSSSISQLGLAQRAEATRMMQSLGGARFVAASVIGAPSISSDHLVQCMFDGELAGKKIDHIIAELKKDFGITVRYKELRDLETANSVYQSVAEIADALRGGKASAPAPVAAEVEEEEAIAMVAPEVVEQVVEHVVEPVVAVAVAQAVPTVAPLAIGRIALIKKQADEKAKHDLMEQISMGIQNKRRYSQLEFIKDNQSPNKRALLINMALKGDDAEKVVSTLIGKSAAKAVQRLVLAELATMPDVDPETVDEDAVAAFAHFTKEGYENVTGIAKGNKRWDKNRGADRPMTPAEKNAGIKTLNDLLKHWPAMPKFPGQTVYRVVHSGQGIDELAQGGASEPKANPTSTSIALDWSRVGEGKTSCKINIMNHAGPNAPVDTRAVSTYTHEGEILLPPKTAFKKVAPEGHFAVFEATLPIPQ